MNIFATREGVRRVKGRIRRERKESKGKEGNKERNIEKGWRERPGGGGNKMERNLSTCVLDVFIFYFLKLNRREINLKSFMPKRIQN